MDYKKLYEEQLKENEKLKQENETLEKIHNGDMKIAKMLKEKWNEEQEKVKKLKEQLHCDDEGFADSDWFHEKLEKHIECHLSGDGEWGSLGFKNLQEFVDAYDKLEEKLQNPVLNRDTRSGPFDIKVNQSYIDDFLKIKDIDVDDADINDKCNMEVVYKLLAEELDGIINNYMTGLHHENIHEYIMINMTEAIDKLISEEILYDPEEEEEEDSDEE